MLYLLTYNLVRVMWKLVPVYRKNVLRLGYSDPGFIDMVCGRERWKLWAAERLPHRFDARPAY